VQKIPADRIIIYGESLGGGAAVDQASRKAHRALVLNRTFTSVPDVAEWQMPLVPSSWFMTNRFNNLAKMPQCPRPVFIAQATDDHIIPPRHAQQLADACQAPCQIFVIEGGHNDPPAADFYAALRTFLETRAPVGDVAFHGVAK
jgi:fermentation-respiration switch protein FrsA (DUF1100 family)